MDVDSVVAVRDVTHTPVLRLFVQDYPGEPVPERKNLSGFYLSKRQ